MKKLIMMLALFAAMGTAAGIEMWYTNKAYSETLELLYKTAESIERNQDALDNPETIMLSEDANKLWEDSKRPLMALVNHNVIRYTDEKFVSLLQQVHSDNYPDATVTVKVLISYLKDLRAENVPMLSNIF